MPRCIKVYSKKLGVTIIVAHHNSQYKNAELATTILDMIGADAEARAAAYLKVCTPEEHEYWKNQEKNS